MQKLKQKQKILACFTALEIRLENRHDIWRDEISTGFSEVLCKPYDVVHNYQANAI